MFPLWYLLLAFLFFVLLTALFFVFNFFHIVKFGLQSTQTTFVLSAYTLGFFMVVGGTLLILATINWDQEIDFDSVFSTKGIVIEV